MTFRDRRDAGRRLAAALPPIEPPAVVVGLPRGGVPVAAEVAAHLGVPLDAFAVRKLGVPGHEELAFGAIASGGVRVLNDDVVRAARLGPAAIEAGTARERPAVDSYGPPRVEMAGRTVVVVDDGLATGATMRAAVAALRLLGAARIVVAVPVGAPETCARLEREADDVVCLVKPARFYAVGTWYDDFSPTTDAEVQALLDAGPEGD